MTANGFKVGAEMRFAFCKQKHTITHDTVTVTLFSLRSLSLF